MNRRAWVAGGGHVAMDGEEIWYRIDGEGETILFAHGYPTSSHDYAPIVATLAKTYRCVTFDFLGFGESSKPRRTYDYALQHRALAAVARAASVSRAVLVAHDYAVTIGQDFLAGTPAAPFDLAGVIFMNGGLDPAQHRARPIQRLLATRLGAAIGPRVLSRGVVLRALRALLVRGERLSDDDTWDAITSRDGLRVMPRLLHYMAERRARRDALVTSLSASSIPTAFLWGVDDPVSGGHVLDAIRPHLHAAIVHELRGVGHYPQVEAPEEIAAHIDAIAARWLSRT